ncbi:MAG: sodium:calcium symporter, partial [Desulfobacteraceae bacterium]
MIHALFNAIYPFHYLVVFCLVQYLLINRLNSLEKKGFEGTEIGTLVMPYCSGVANIIFVYVVAESNLPGIPVIENCVVNNVTNLTFILGVTTLFYPITIVSRSPEERHSLKEVMKRRQTMIKTKIDQVNLTGTSITLLFFTGVLWA